MIDIQKLQSTHEMVYVEPSDGIFAELGNNTYDFKDLMSELIDNSLVFVSSEAQQLAKSFRR